MVYLFLETWVFILLAGLLGLFFGWLIWGLRDRGAHTDQDFSNLRIELDRCRARCAELEASQREMTMPVDDSGQEKQETGAEEAETSNDAEESDRGGVVDSSNSLTAASDQDDEDIDDSWRPQELTAPHGGADDLRRIKGVGPVLEKTLNELGIYHFWQVAAFTEQNIKWVDNHLSFHGRIHREQWVSQAKNLAEGGSTAFSERYDKGGADPS